MKALRRKLLRDLWGMKGQALAIAMDHNGGDVGLVQPEQRAHDRLAAAALDVSTTPADEVTVTVSANVLSRPVKKTAVIAAFR